MAATATSDAVAAQTGWLNLIPLKPGANDTFVFEAEGQTPLNADEQYKVFLALRNGQLGLVILPSQAMKPMIKFQL